MDGYDEYPEIRVMALHALEYCERLFFLEEVEEIRVADAAVWAGRRLHVELDEPEEIVSLTMRSSELGIRGRVDALRRRDGTLHLVEHKRGGSRRGAEGEPAGAWESDRIQALAYALLLEEHSKQEIPEVRIRYHRDNKTVRISVTKDGRAAVRAAVERARALMDSTERPPVTENENLCVRCSLAPVCLPEEVRLLEAANNPRDPNVIVGEPEELGEPGEPGEPGESSESGENVENVESAEDSDNGDSHGVHRRPTALRLFPADSERRSLHVVTQGARVGRSRNELAVAERDQNKNKKEKKKKVGIRQVSDIVLHGYAQITTQAMRLCADEGVPVHLMTATGAYIGVFAGGSGSVQRRIRQFRALIDADFAHARAQQLTVAKIEMQLRHVLRASRKESALRATVEGSIESIRSGLRGAQKAADRDTLMGYEGAGARAYFKALAGLVSPAAGEAMLPHGRTRRPPKDRFNALLSFGYGLLYRDVVGAILRVGLDPAFGFFHQPRSTAFPLALDLMELFRVPIVDMAILGAVNRRTFDADEDFTVAGEQVWLSESGRKKFIEVYERRKHEEYRHPAIGYTLSYTRMIELEVRLLEKEWSGEPGLFARLRLR